jgi:hypothetical protein
MVFAQPPADSDPAASLSDDTFQDASSTISSTIGGAATPSATTGTNMQSNWTPSGVSATDGDSAVGEQPNLTPVTGDFPIDKRPVLGLSKDIAGFTAGIVRNLPSRRSFDEVAHRYFQLPDGTSTVFDCGSQPAADQEGSFAVAAAALKGLKGFSARSANGLG